MAKRLSSRELLFCSYYALFADPFEAARHAGYQPDRLRAATADLLRREDIREQVDRCRAWMRQSSWADDALAGLYRLAVCSGNDAVRLLTEEQLSPEELGRLDLFSVSEIRRCKNGSCVIRFHDRLKALSLLLEAVGEGQAPGASLYEALEKSARAVAGEAGNHAP